MIYALASAMLATHLGFCRAKLARGDCFYE